MAMPKMPWDAPPSPPPKTLYFESPKMPSLEPTPSQPAPEPAPSTPEPPSTPPPSAETSSTASAEAELEAEIAAKQKAIEMAKLREQLAALDAEMARLGNQP